MADGSEVEVEVDAESGTVLSQKVDDGKDDDDNEDGDDNNEDGEVKTK